MTSSIAYTAVLDVRRGTAEHLAKLLRGHRERLGSRKGTRVLNVFKQAALMLRWFVDGTRLVQLALDNGISVPTAYRYLHEGLAVLADHAPDLSTALERAAAAGYTHMNLGGTLIRTDRVAAVDPSGADLWWSGKHKHHGGNVQVIAAPVGWPLRISRVRPGREHDTTSARAHGLVDTLNRLAATLGVPTLTDLGYENAGPGFRHPVKRPKGGELAEPDKAFNAVVRGIHAVSERANALLKVTFKALPQGQPRPRSHHPYRSSRPRPTPARTRSHRLNEDHQPSRDITEKGSVPAAAGRPQTDGQYQSRGWRALPARRRDGDGGRRTGRGHGHRPQTVQGGRPGSVSAARRGRRSTASCARRDDVLSMPSRVTGDISVPQRRARSFVGRAGGWSGAVSVGAIGRDAAECGRSPTHVGRVGHARWVRDRSCAGRWHGARCSGLARS